MQQLRAEIFRIYFQQSLYSETDIYPFTYKNCLYRSLYDAWRETKEPKDTNPFKIDFVTGDFTFYKTTGNFPFGGKEFLVITTLYQTNSHMVSYLELIQSYNTNIEQATKAQKDDLYLVIRDIKKRLNISSEAETTNPDIIKNVKGFGYRLILKPKK